MHFDDRLATVLRNRAESDLGARIQYRQLLDILGEPVQRADESLMATAWLRLAALAETIPESERASILRRGGWRISNPELILRLVDDEADVASAALECVRLRPDAWIDLIPRLPIRARGFLRLRKGLPDEAMAVLEQLGVYDRALPLPVGQVGDELVERMEGPEAGPVASPDDVDSPDASSAPNEIASIVARIEAFRQNRDRGAGTGPDDASDQTQDQTRDPVTFTTDSAGTILQSSHYESSLVGTALNDLLNEATGNAATMVRHHQPFRRIEVAFAKPHPMAGLWVVDAYPAFEARSGAFDGYRGSLRALSEEFVSVDPAKAQADRIRQLLHELKTPVNAIQGFAEVIQQQMFGPTPHHYRSLAAQIAGDSAEMMSGFDDLDRIAQLESGAMQLEDGRTDLLLALQPYVRQLRDVMEPRSTKMTLLAEPGIHEVAVARADIDRIAWRLLATMASAAAASETVEITVQRERGQVVMRIDLPGALSREEDIFAMEATVAEGPISAGLFGAGFALRLTRSEIRTVGGHLERDGDQLVLGLPPAENYEAEHVETASA